MKSEYRGMMLAPFAPAADVCAALDVGAKVFRYQIVDPSWQAALGSEADYYAFVDQHLAWIDALLVPFGNTKFIIDLHTLPGGLRVSPNGTPRHNMFDERPECRQWFRNVWTNIATRFGANQSILAFDLMNEPAGNRHQTEGLYRRTIQDIRVITNKPCLVSTPFGDPTRVSEFGDYSRLANVWPTVHMYLPMAVTHQGVLPQYPAGKVFPTPKWDKAAMKSVLTPFKNYMPDSPHLIGEFSISTYADTDSRVKYLTACIDIFNSWGFMWTYHAWRESPVWNAEEPVEVLAVLQRGLR